MEQSEFLHRPGIVWSIYGQPHAPSAEVRDRWLRGADGLPGEDIAANLVDACANQIAGFVAYPRQRI
jgi:hypothetical protein